MNKELIEGAINAQTGYDMKLVNGTLLISIKYDGSGADVTVSVAISPEYFLDKLADAIPGKIDDFIFEYLKQHFLQK
jgi:hypothetical protein